MLNSGNSEHSLSAIALSLHGDEMWLSIHLSYNVHVMFILIKPLHCTMIVVCRLTYRGDFFLFFIFFFAICKVSLQRSAFDVRPFVRVTTDTGSHIAFEQFQRRLFYLRDFQEQSLPLLPTRTDTPPEISSSFPQLRYFRPLLKGRKSEEGKQLIGIHYVYEGI